MSEDPINPVQPTHGEVQYDRLSRFYSIDGARTDGRWLLGWEHRMMWNTETASQSPWRAAVWELQTGRQVFHFYGRVDASAFSPSGCYLLVADDRVVTLWDVERGTRVSCFHADLPVQAVACPSDTSFIIASNDGRTHRLDLRK
jgi:WD40 repeat protein